MPEAVLYSVSSGLVAPRNPLSENTRFTLAGSAAGGGCVRRRDGAEAHMSPLFTGPNAHAGVRFHEHTELGRFPTLARLSIYGKWSNGSYASSAAAREKGGGILIF